MRHDTSKTTMTNTSQSLQKTLYKIHSVKILKLKCEVVLQNYKVNLQNTEHNHEYSELY